MLATSVRTKARNLLAASIAAAALFVSGVMAPSTATAASSHDIDRTSAQAVAQAFTNRLRPALNVPIQWTGNTSQCKPGAPSAAAQAATFKAINYYRAMAGLPAVTEDKAASQHAQKRALLMHANNDIDHFPPSSWKCAKINPGLWWGFENLAYGASGAAAIVLYIRDHGVDSLGHRRGILDPTATTMGSGSTGLINALVGSGTDNPAKPVAWPPSGYVPAEVMAGMDWSYDAPDVDFARAKVAVTKNGKAVAATVVDRYGYIIDGMSWRVPSVTEPSPGAVDTYRVSITGIEKPASYTVKVFSPVAPLAKVAVTGRAKVGYSLTAAPTVKKLAPTTVTYQWLRDGKTITGATGRTYRPKPADVGHKISVKATGKATGFGSTVRKSAAVKVVKGSIKQGSVSVTGTTKVGKRLTAAVSGWGPTGVRYSYQWLNNGKVIKKATGKTYVLRPSDARDKVTVRVIVEKSGYATAKKTATSVVVRR